MTFYAIQIEEVPGFGWEGGPEFDTLILPMQSGRERRKGRRAVVRHSYVCPFLNIPVQQYLNIKRVHLAMMGSLHTFLHRDRLDEDAVDEPFGTGDGATTVFQLKKTYNPGGGASYERTITKPNTDTVVVMVGGVVTEATVSATTGQVTFAVAPADGAALTWSGKHFIPVRFLRDDLPFTIDNKSGTAFITNGSVELIEVLDE